MGIKKSFHEWEFPLKQTSYRCLKNRWIYWATHFPFFLKKRVDTKSNLNGLYTSSGLLPLKPFARDGTRRHKVATAARHSHLGRHRFCFLPVSLLSGTAIPLVPGSQWAKLERPHTVKEINTDSRKNMTCMAKWRNKRVSEKGPPKKGLCRICFSCLRWRLFSLRSYSQREMPYHNDRKQAI